MFGNLTSFDYQKYALVNQFVSKFDDDGKSLLKVGGWFGVIEIFYEIFSTTTANNFSCSLTD